MFKGIRSILKLLMKYRWRVVSGICCLLLVDAAQLVIPLVIKHVVDGVASYSVTLAWIGKQSLILLAIALTIAGSRFLWRYFLFSASRLAERDLRGRVFEHALTLSVREYMTTRTGDVMALAINDVESVRQAMAMGFLAAIDATIYPLVALTAMFLLDPVLTAFIIIPLPLLAAAMGLSLKAVYSRWDAVQASFQDMTEKARESLSGMRLLKAYVQHQGDSIHFDRHSEDYYRKFMRYTGVDALFHPLILLMAGSCIAILLGVGGVRVIEGQTSVGTFVALATYLGMLTWPMIAGGWMLTLLQRAAASMDRINVFLGKPPQTTVRASRERITSGRVEFRDLTFRYPAVSINALEDISFQIPPGGSLGIVGEIGSGKSTIAQVLCRIFEPGPGEVFLDGRDVLDMDLEDLRAAVAYVPQEAFLFSDTVEENLRIGNPEASRRDIEQAASVAALHEEILSFPKGYDTLLGERGITLSGGQKQRLCLARALLKEAPVLLLDDTLSAVDAGVEQQILDNLRNEIRKRSTLIISHRVSAVKHLDHILVLEDGRVIQQGRHEELVAQEGFYRDLVELQELEQ
ncbi:MAG: ABC transporter ATP-binding protein [Acidobacteriota bacterium]|jgi:ATP-binding cassette, subfamily B, multidrug efflux pump